MTLEAFAPTKTRRPGPRDLSIRRLDYHYVVEGSDVATIALSGIDLDVPQGRFVCLVGQSGCGKSTLLNLVAGLLKATSGEIRFDDQVVEAPGTDRSVVFQHASLLPWRDVRGNIRFGMEMQRRFSADEMDRRTKRATEMVGLAGFGQHFPSQLSGGMQQRVNLARALATDPLMLLLDEPFSALDSQTREVMQAETLRIWNENAKTVLFVTHQIDEAVFLADEIVVMAPRPGRVVSRIPVPFARPRSLDLKRSPEFQATCDHIWSVIGDNAPGGSEPEEAVR